MMSSAVLPPATIGILGSGQLGRFSAMAARRFGYRVVVLSPEQFSPAGQVADCTVVGPLDETTGYEAVARHARVMTYEFENVATTPLEAVAATCPIYPHPRVLHTTQHRLREKTTLRSLGVPTAEFVAVDRWETLQQGLAKFGKGVLKTVTGGYDGKGQYVIEDGNPAARHVYDQLSADSTRPLILERFVSFTRELSVIVGRGAAGDVHVFPLAENVHRNSILHVTMAPATADPALEEEARHLAANIATGLQLVGVMGIELFQTEAGLLVNELAPRPHNSGHYTLDACHTSQFEQHIRAVTGLPLATTEQHTPAAMLNILGEHMASFTRHFTRIVADPCIKVHMYGKEEARPGRKMGHVTALGPSVTDALSRLEKVWRYLADSPLL